MKAADAHYLRFAACQLQTPLTAGHTHALTPDKLLNF